LSPTWPAKETMISVAGIVTFGVGAAGHGRSSMPGKNDIPVLFTNST